MSLKYHLLVLMKCSKEKLIELISMQGEEIQSLKDQLRELQRKLPKKIVAIVTSHRPVMAMRSQILKVSE